jgi:hypothetical protein
VRFLVQPVPESLERARPPVRAFLAFTGVLLVALVAHRAVQGLLSPAELVRVLEPAPGERLGPVALWEEVHQGAFLYGFLLLTLGSLLVVCPVAPALRNGLLAVATGAALVDLLAPLLPLAWPAAGEGWAPLRIAAFLVAVAALLASAVVAWLTFGRPPRRADG